MLKTKLVSRNNKERNVMTVEANYAQNKSSDRRIKVVTGGLSVKRWKG
jgi:hypothetical protein